MSFPVPRLRPARFARRQSRDEKPREEPGPKYCGENGWRLAPRALVQRPPPDHESCTNICAFPSLWPPMPFAENYTRWASGQQILSAELPLTPVRRFLMINKAVSTAICVFQQAPVYLRAGSGKIVSGGGMGVSPRTALAATH